MATQWVASRGPDSPVTNVSSGAGMAFLLHSRSASCIFQEIDPSVKTLLPLVPFAYFCEIKRSFFLFVLFI